MAVNKRQLVSLAKGVALAPLLAAPASIIWSVVFSSIGRYSITTSDYVTSILGVAVGVTYVGYMAIFVIGLPLYLILQRFARLKVRYFATTGVLFSVIFAAGLKPFNSNLAGLFFVCAIVVSSGFGYFVSRGTEA